MLFDTDLNIMPAAVRVLNNPSWQKPKTNFMKIPFSFTNREELRTICNNTLHGLEVCIRPGEKHKSVMQSCFFLNDTPCKYYASPDEHIVYNEKCFLFDLVIGTIPLNCIKITAKRFNNIHPAK